MIVGVVGNEACDADSIVSAIVYAWFQNETVPDTEFVPFVQCQLDELKDRLDFREICEIARFSIDNPPPVRSLHDNCDDLAISEWILLDHHYPSKLHKANFPNHLVVREIVDHHQVVSSEAREFVSHVKKVDIRTIGSTCTILAERLAGTSVPPHFLMMLFLTIVIDTGIPRRTA